MLNSIFFLAAWAVGGNCSPIAGPQQPQLPLAEKHGAELVVENSPSVGIPIEMTVHPNNLFFPIFKANVSLGMPPQKFELALDTVDTGVWARSADCGSFCGAARTWPRYFSNQSSTYKEDGEGHRQEWAGAYYSGVLSRDTLEVGGHKIENHLFEEWRSVITDFIGFYDYFDGVLGLAPPWTRDGKGKPSYYTGLPSFLTSLFDSGALDNDPVFSMRMPNSPKDKSGELRIGGRNRWLYDDSITAKLPVINATWEGISDRWTVAPSHVTINTARKISQNLSAENWAVVHSGSPWLVLPPNITRTLHEAIGARPFDWFHEFVECANRFQLPTLTFGFGDVELTISAYEYTWEVEIPQEGSFCLVSVMSSDELGVPENSIVLGSPFMRGFYSTFDMKNRQIEFSKLA